jgi:hypothetical protein
MRRKRIWTELGYGPSAFCIAVSIRAVIQNGAIAYHIAIGSDDCGGVVDGLLERYCRDKSKAGDKAEQQGGKGGHYYRSFCPI